MAKDYKYIKEINSQEELEQYVIGTNTRKSWTGDEVEYETYSDSKKIAETLFREVCGAYDLKANPISAGQVYKNENLKDIYEANQVFPTLHSKWNKDLWENKFEDIEEATTFFNELDTIQNFIISDKNFNLDDMNSSINNVFTILKGYESGKNIDYKKDMLLDHLSIMSKNNKYEMVEGKIYSNFFAGEQKIIDATSFKYSEDNPKDYLLKINCDIELPKGSVLDAFCDVEAQNIKGGFLGVAGNFKANDITCDKLYSASLDCNILDTSNSSIDYNYTFDELTNAGLKLAMSLEEFDEEVELTHFDSNRNLKNNIIIGEYQFDEVAINLDEIIDEEGENASRYAIARSNGLDVFLYPNSQFFGGTVNAKKIITDNMICGDITAKNVYCKNIVVANSVVDENIYKDNKLNHNITSYFNEEWDEVEDFEYYLVSPNWKLEYRNANIDNLIANSVSCNNLNTQNAQLSNFAFISGDLDAGNTGYINTRDLTVSGNINAKDITANEVRAKDIDVKNLYTNDLSAKKLTLNGYFYNSSEDYNISLDELHLPEDTLCDGEELAILKSSNCATFYFDENKPVQNKAPKPQHTPKTDINKGLKFD